MTELICREVAGIHLDIWCEKSMEVYEPSSDYEPFARTERSGPAAVHTEIYLTLDDIPAIEKLTKIFDSGQALSIFRDGDEYFFRFHPPFSELPSWVASIKQNFRKVTVYCSDELLRRRNGKVLLTSPVHYPLDQILIMFILGHSEGALLHAAGIHFNGKGCIFPGKSGAGKSTIMRQFAHRQDIGLLSDDRIAVRKIDGAFRAFGTPWAGDARIAVNASVPLSGIFFITQASTNRIEEITAQKALERLLPITSIPWYDPEIIPKMLSFCGDLLSHVPAYELQFKPNIEVVDVLEEFVSA